MVQEQYWKEIYQLKTHINFIELQLEKSENIDRGLNILLAIASSSSIGAWVIWTHLSWLWGRNNCVISSGICDKVISSL